MPLSFLEKNVYLPILKCGHVPRHYFSGYLFRFDRRLGLAGIGRSFFPVDRGRVLSQTGLRLDVALFVLLVFSEPE